MNEFAQRHSDIQPVWGGRGALLVGGVAGVAWNAFGFAKLVQSLVIPAEYPAWMSVAFAAGVVGGLIGCVLLLARQPLAVRAFIVSLAGYVVLYAGDITEGVFARHGVEQVVILSTVIAIAVGLLVWSRHLEARGALRGAGE